MKMIRKIFGDNKAATAIEYGLIAALIAIACIGGMRSLAGKLNTTFSNVGNNLPAS